MNYDTADMIEDARQAITSCQLWEWFMEYEPEEGKGFLLSQHPNLDRINAAMKYTGHSGASYAITMRILKLSERHWK